MDMGKMEYNNKIKESELGGPNTRELHSTPATVKEKEANVGRSTREEGKKIKREGGGRVRGGSCDAGGRRRWGLL